MKVQLAYSIILSEFDIDKGAVVRKIAGGNIKRRPAYVLSPIQAILIFLKHITYRHK